MSLVQPDAAKKQRENLIAFGKAYRAVADLQRVLELIEKNSKYRDQYDSLLNQKKKLVNLCNDYLEVLGVAKGQVIVPFYTSSYNVNQMGLSLEQGPLGALGGVAFQQGVDEQEKDASITEITKGSLSSNDPKELNTAKKDLDKFVTSVEKLAKFEVEIPEVVEMATPQQIEAALMRFIDQVAKSQEGLNAAERASIKIENQKDGSKVIKIEDNSREKAISKSVLRACYASGIFFNANDTIANVEGRDESFKLEICTDQKSGDQRLNVPLTHLEKLDEYTDQLAVTANAKQDTARDFHFREQEQFESTIRRPSSAATAMDIPQTQQQPQNAPPPAAAMMGRTPATPTEAAMAPTLATPIKNASPDDIAATFMRCTDRLIDFVASKGQGQAAMKLPRVQAQGGGQATLTIEFGKGKNSVYGELLIEMDKSGIKYRAQAPSKDNEGCIIFDTNQNVSLENLKKMEQALTAKFSSKPPGLQQYHQHVEQAEKKPAVRSSSVSVITQPPAPDEPNTRPRNRNV